MKLRWLLRREVTWTRHQALSLVLVLLVVPGTAAFTALGFQHVLPEDTPVAVVPAEGTDEESVDLVVAALTTFTDPVRYESERAAKQAMARERVYAVVTVPPGLFRAGANVTLTMYRDGSMVPYERPAQAVANILDRSLSRAAPATVSVREVETGSDRTLSAYLVPSFVVILLLVLSLVYLPRVLVEESAAMDRIRVEASLSAAVLGPLLTFTILALVPAAAAAAAGTYIGYGIALLSPGALLAFWLTALYTGAFAAAVVIAANFDPVGRLVNLAVLLFVLTFSGLVYPVGFFSASRRELIRLVPVHYSMIVVRSHVLRGVAVTDLPAEYGIVLATTVACLGLLAASLFAFERRA